MSARLIVQSRQRQCEVRLPMLRQILRAFLREMLGCRDFDLGIYLLDPDDMARLNEQFLQHQGPTDVITFDYAEGGTPALHGEVFVCPQVAVEQARRFRTHWQSELVRYAVHGILHLCGFDDTTPQARRKMKREENRWMKELAGRFALRSLARQRTVV